MEKSLADAMFYCTEGKLFSRFDDIEVGYLDKQSGYRKFKWNNRAYRTHRIIFLMHHGYMPQSIDHINGVRDDNRIENLRECSIRENNMNAKTPNTNTSGVKGVSWHKTNKKWQATLRVYGKKHHLGYFTDKKLAELIVMEVRDILHGEFANNGESNV